MRIVYAYDVESPLTRRWLAAQVFPHHLGDLAALMAIDGRFRGLHIARCAGFNLDKTKHILVPADQVNFSTAARRAEVARHHGIALLAKVEVSVFFPAGSGALVLRTRVRRQHAGGEPIKAVNDGAND